MYIGNDTCNTMNPMMMAATISIRRLDPGSHPLGMEEGLEG